MNPTFYSLKISKLIKETKDSTSLYFHVPDDLKEIFSYKAGQYLTLKFEIQGSKYRRSYSICTAPHENLLGVTSKKVDRGLISAYINDHIKEGQEIEVMPPAGKFGFESDFSTMQDLYFFAAGSGITPIFSIIKSVLEQNPKSTCYLLYGNRNEESIIYYDQLKELENKYTEQIYVIHTLTQPKKEKGITSLFRKSKSTWTGWTGRIDEAAVEKFRDEFPAKSKDSHFFFCGPGNMIENLTNYLLQTKGIEKSRVHREHFIGAETEKSDITSETSLVRVSLNGRQIEIEVPPEKTILETLLDLGYDPPYSCTSGACSTCVAKVISGSAEMEVCYALDDDEIAEGYILTCQSHPTTPEMEIIYET